MAPARSRVGVSPGVRATNGASATIAPTMQAPNRAPSIAPVATWLTGPKPASPNTAPIRSRRRREPSNVRASRSRLPPIRRPPASGMAMPATAPAIAAATMLRRVHGERPLRAPNHRPNPTDAPRTMPSPAPVMSPGDWPSNRLKASSPSSFTTAPTSMPPSAPPAIAQRQRGPGNNVDAAIPRLTPAPPASAATSPTTLPEYTKRIVPGSIPTEASR